MNFKEYADNELRNQIFQGRTLNIAPGFEIDVRTCKVKKDPTTTLDNAAKIAASYLYNAINVGQRNYEGTPIWINSISFRDENSLLKPAVTVIDNHLDVNKPPFKGDITFWRLFAKYWYQNVLVSKARALSTVQRTREEKQLVEMVEKTIKDLPLIEHL